MGDELRLKNLTMGLTFPSLDLDDEAIVAISVLQGGHLDEQYCAVAETATAVWRSRWTNQDTVSALFGFCKQ